MQQWIKGLGIVLMLGFAQAANLNFLATISNGPPDADPLVRVTVSGSEVFNARAKSFNIPVGTTGHVVVQIVELPQWQTFEGWTGVCAGLLGGQTCEFDVGLPTTYDVGIGVLNHKGKVRFTSSSTVGLNNAPKAFTLGAEHPSGNDSLNVNTLTQSTFDLLIGSWAFKPEQAEGSNCLQLPSQTTLSANVTEGSEVIVNVPFAPSKCRVVVNLLQPIRGSVQSSPPGIDCPNGPIAPGEGSACSALFAYQSQVTLTPVPDPGFVFAGWNNCFTLEPICTVPSGPNPPARIPSFAAASPGSADLSLDPASLKAEDAGGGNVRLSFALKNNGASPAIATRAQIGFELLKFSQIPTQVSDGGSCDAVGRCLWSLEDLAPGQSKSLSLTAPSSQTEFALKACTLSNTPDPTQVNNCASATRSTGGNPPPPPPPPTAVSVALGAANPAAKTVAKNSKLVPVLQVLVTPPAGSAVTDYALAGLTLKASGTGKDHLDIESLRLYPDNNGNGIVDASETGLQIASGKFSTDDGELQLSFAPTGILNGRNYLVVVDIAPSLAAQVSLLLVGFIGLGMVWQRRRLSWLVVLALIYLASCNPSVPEQRTFKLGLSAVSVQLGGQPASASGIPLESATLSVEK